MKITKHGIIGVNDEAERIFYLKLKWGIKNLFKLNISELPSILETLGVKLPVGIKEHYYYYTTHEAKIVLDSGEIIVFHMGNMTNTYPYIICNEKEWILATKDRKVARLIEF